jgi:hypothetical protein
MSEYDSYDEVSRDIHIALSALDPENKIFRVIYAKCKSGTAILSLIFRTKDDAKEFLSSALPKYSCDTSMFKASGVSVTILDSTIIYDLLKSANNITNGKYK